MTDVLDVNGATRLIPILGDPIAQVKSPAGMSRTLQARGRNALCVPMHVSTAAFDEVVRMLAMTQNADGFIATVPHKFAAFHHCATASGDAQFLGAANVVRRNADGSWHGGMVDGLGFVEAARRAGCVLPGQRALLAGAGGAGSAIAFALLDAGVASLAIHDADAKRRDDLIARLAARFPGRVDAGSADPAGYTFVANATPMGMRVGDAQPIDVTRLNAAMFVGDVITVPEISPLLVAARAAGCNTQTGVGMFHAVLELMIDFFLEMPPA